MVPKEWGTVAQQRGMVAKGWDTAGHDSSVAGQVSSEGGHGSSVAGHETVYQRDRCTNPHTAILKVGQFYSPHTVIRKRH